MDLTLLVGAHSRAVISHLAFSYYLSSEVGVLQPLMRDKIGPAHTYWGKCYEKILCVIFNRSYCFFVVLY